MVTHPAALVGGMGSIVSGVAVLLATGAPSLALLPAIGFVGITTMAALFVPSSPVFQEYVNRNKRAQARDEERSLLITEIQKRVGGRNSYSDGREAGLYNPYRTSHEPSASGTYQECWDRYYRMMDRLESLRQIAASRNTTLTDREMERLSHATLDYLRLFYSRVLIFERRRGNSPQMVESQISLLDKQLKVVKSAVDRKKLETAKADLLRVAERSEGLATRDTTTAASMVSMSEAFEEVYQRIMVNPTGNVTETLLEAEEKLTIEDELASSGDLEVEATLRKALLETKLKS